METNQIPKFNADNLDVTAFFKACHTCSVDHGWWDDKYSDADDPKLWLGEKLALTMGECIEASAEERRFYFTSNGKPEGCVIECADIVIRLADLCGRAGVLDHAAYDVNKNYTYTYPWEPGQLKLFRNLQHDYPFMAFIVPINSCLESFRRTPDWKLVVLDTLYFIYTEAFYKFAEPDNESAFHKALIMKYEYNLSRPYRHGGLKA
tara:strand:- start:9777 stop:10394 length:618 start_codon:yes stop_codon:yes gene_type:complete